MSTIDMSALAKPFPIDAHSFRVLSKSKDGKKAQWYTYISARDVQERLSDVDQQWQSSYRVIELTDAMCTVECTLTVGGATRSDVGADNRNTNRAGEFTDNEGNYIKGAYSDALKRAAVNYGVGAYLYSLRNWYVPVDEYGKFTPEAEAIIKKTLAEDIQRMFGPKVTTNRTDTTPPPVEKEQTPAANVCSECHAPEGKPHATSCSQHVKPKVEDVDFREPSTSPTDEFLDIPSQAAGMVNGKVAGKKAAETKPVTPEFVAFANGVVEWALKTQRGGDTPCSEPQYGYLVSVINKITGVADSHHSVLSVLTGRPTSSENRVDKKLAGELLDYLTETKTVKTDGGIKTQVKNDKYKATYVAVIKWIFASSTEQIPA